ncbi:DDB1-CUL4 associated factor 1 isoform X2 [Wolffia australiana]
MNESGNSSLSNGRSSHLVGRLGNLVLDNDEFYELISSTFLSENRYSISVRAAAARLILSGSSTWIYPPVFDEGVVENIKRWVMEDITCSTGDQCNWKNECGPDKATDSEMLKAYSTGLLAISLTGGGEVVEDVLTSGLSAKLMRYLRLRVIGEVNVGQKDVTFPSDNKHVSGASLLRSREDNRRRLRSVTDATRVEPLRIGEEISGDDQSAEREVEPSEASESPPEVTGEVEPSDDKSCGREGFDGRIRVNEKHGVSRSAREEDGDENDLSRRRTNRGVSRARGRGRGSEGNLETEQLTLGRGRSVRDRSFPRNSDVKTSSSDTLDVVQPVESDCLMNCDNGNDRFRECSIGSRDISDLVKKAIEAAETEARVANAPPEAVKAAGDAAAELVKTSALEVWKSTNDEEAAVLAASKAASTVVEAAIATDVSRQCQANPSEETLTSESADIEKDESEEFCIVDEELLSQLREKYSIQCLEILGEYVEALGPVLHEKGVDVCLALLQRCFKDKSSSQVLLLLPEILKLICTLAAHRKFAAVFIDRGGIQRLLSVQRVPQTFFGISSCLFTIGTLQGIMERVCALPSEIVNQTVELALQLLNCSQDQARKNAAIFFAAAFVFRAIIDSFDAQEGLQKMLNLLQGMASVRSGGGATGGASILPNLGTNLRSDRLPADVLTSLEKQIAYQTCVALRQYYRAHLLLLVDSLRPNKSSRSLPRHSSSARAAYKPLDLSNEAMEAVFVQIQRDRKLGAALVRTRWPPVDYFLFYNGHITMLELCHAPPAERYLHDLAQYALGVLHIVTLFPYSRKMIVNAALSNDRTGMAVILDALNSAGGVDPEVIQQALNLLVNLVCPPPAISNKPPPPTQGFTSAAVNAERSTSLSIQNEPPRNGETSSAAFLPMTMASGVVGDRRISLGSGAGCAGLAAQLEQGYRQARESVRANNGIKVLLHLLHPRMIAPPATLDCLRALTCRVLLGLARDDTIAHILTQLQVGKKLSELIRDHGGGQAYGAGEQGRWQTELAQVAIELISIVTNSGRACTLAATDAAAPTLRRIERAAIAAATPVTYHSKELLLLIHEHLLASGLTGTAALLQKEAQLCPLPYLAPPQLLHQAPAPPAVLPGELTWPSGRAPVGFLSSSPSDQDQAPPSSKKKPLQFSSSFSHSKPPVAAPSKPDPEPLPRTPILLPMKRKVTDSKDSSILTPPPKRISTLDSSAFRTPIPESPAAFSAPSLDAPAVAERVTLDSLVVQYLKHQHRQCPAPITTLPPLSLLQPHMCPEPRRSLDAPVNVAARMSTRELDRRYGGGHGPRRDRQLVYSRFRPLRSCRDDSALLTCVSFLGSAGRIAAGTHTGELKIFRTDDGSLLESHQCHQSAITTLQSAGSVLLTSGHYDVRLWDSGSLVAPLHAFEGCKAARFSHSGEVFAALPAEAGRREVLLYDVQTCQLSLRLADPAPAGPGPGRAQALLHFSPLDSLLLYNGLLWDPRVPSPLHRFDQFTDYGGGGFHPSGNEVIINSEVWDLRKLRLLRSVMGLDQTVIRFNGRGDVIYGILRRNVEDLASAVQTRRVRHPLFPAFRTMDAATYADIATVAVDRCVLDLAVEPTDSVLAVVAMDDHDEMFSSARLYEIGRRRPTDDDSDPDELADSDEDEDDEDDDADDSDVGSILLGRAGDSDDEIGVGLALDSADDEDEDEDFAEEEAAARGILELVSDGDDEDDEDDDDDSEVLEVLSSGEEADFASPGFAF